MDAKAIKDLKIFKKGIFCGLLRRRKDGGVEFIYDSKYLSDENSEDLCFNLKKRAEPYVQQGVNLLPYFAGLLPEGLRFKILLRKVKTSADDLFSLFASLGSDVIGDVSTESPAKPGSSESPRLPVWNEINFYEFFLSSMKDPHSFYASDFAGVQEKISASMLSLPIKVKNQGAYILKLNPKDKLHLVYNEWACLYLAKLCGVSVNDSQLITDKDGDEGLLIRRFDRVLVNDNWVACHQEDICQILNLFPAEKYRLPLKDIFTTIQKFTTAPLLETYELLKLVIFSYLVGNGDLHAKNISLIESPLDGRITLTPAYDLI